MLITASCRISQTGHSQAMLVKLTKIGWQAAVDRRCGNGGVASCDGQLMQVRNDITGRVNAFN
jgi:hypothetical protein